jgi:hypothetical protein
MSCSHVSSCPLFALFSINASLKVWRLNYCDADFERCERFQRSKRGEKCPDTLLPNGRMLAAPAGAERR